MHDPNDFFKQQLENEIEFYSSLGLFAIPYKNKLLLSTAPLNITRQNELIDCCRRPFIFVAGGSLVLDKFHDDFYKVHTKRDYIIDKKINCSSFCACHSFLDFGGLVSCYNTTLFYKDKLKFKGVNSLDDFEKFNYDQLNFLLDYLESQYKQINLCLSNMSSSKRQKKIRLQNSISLLMEYAFNSFGGFGSPYYFITLTLPQEYLENYSLDEIKENLKNWVFKYLGLSISNFDFGLDPLKTHRIHLHVLCAGLPPFLYDFNKKRLNYKKIYSLYRSAFGSNAIINIETGSFNDDSDIVLSKYVSKFSSHALKDSTKLFRSLYSPSFRKLRRSCQNIAIYNDRDEYKNLLCDLFESYDLENSPLWFESISDKNKVFFDSSHRIKSLF